MQHVCTALFVSFMVVMRSWAAKCSLWQNTTLKRCAQESNGPQHHSHLWFGKSESVFALEDFMLWVLTWYRWQYFSLKRNSPLLLSQKLRHSEVQLFGKKTVVHEVWEGGRSDSCLIMCWQLMCIQALSLFILPVLFSPYFMAVGRVGAPLFFSIAG